MHSEPVCIVKHCILQQQPFSIEHFSLCKFSTFLLTISYSLWKLLHWFYCWNVVFN